MQRYLRLYRVVRESRCLALWNPKLIFNHSSFASWSEQLLNEHVNPRSAPCPLWYVVRERQLRSHSYFLQLGDDVQEKPCQAHEGNLRQSQSADRHLPLNRVYLEF